MTIFASHRLKRVAEVRFSGVDKKTASGEKKVVLCNYVDVYKNDRITDELAFMEATATNEQLRRFHLLPGDVVITKDSETADDIGAASLVEATRPDLVCGYHLALIRPDQSKVEPRFLFYLCLSKPFRDQLTSMATGVTRYGLRFDSVSGAGVALPPLNLQRALADHLDNELAAIDATVAQLKKVGELLDERRERVAAELFASLKTKGDIPLKRLVETVTVGIVVTPAAWYVDEGVPALRGVNVFPGRLDLNDLVQLSAEGHRLHEKSELKAGDLVVVRTGQAGACAVIPEGLEPLNCIDLLLVKPGRGVDSRFLMHIINSAVTQAHVEQHSVGALQAHFNVESLREVPVPNVPLEKQQEIANKIDSTFAANDEALKALDRTMSLLAERREVLITEAVTGKLNIEGRAA